MTQETPQALFRLRVGYKKSGRLAYLGHLEVIGTIERIIRRAALPYAVTQGFSPHMRIGYTSALPVGTSSTCEWYDVFLTELVDSEDALNRLRASSPADLEPFVAGYIDVRSPALTAQITRVRYKIVLRIAREIACDANAIEAALARIHSTPELPYLRGKKNKVLDLAKTLLSYSVERQSDDLVSVELDTYCDNDGSLRPELIIAAIDQLARGLGLVQEPIQSTGVQAFACFSSYRVCRVAQCMEDENGKLCDPFGRQVTV